jgi:hypothetical protein
VSLLGGEARGEDVRWPFPFLAAASYRISTTSGDTTFFIFPERDEKDRAMELLQTAEAETVRRVLRILEDGRE